MDYTERLDALRTVIAGECDRRMTRDHGLGVDEVARWLLDHQRGAVTEGLTELVGQVMEQLNDDFRVRRVLQANPELEPLEDGMREVSKTLSVPLWFLLGLDERKQQQCCAAFLLIHQLRADENAATHEACTQAVECLRPVMEGNPGMTVGQAFQEIDRQTDETIRRLEHRERASEAEE